MGLLRGPPFLMTSLLSLRNSLMTSSYLVSAKLPARSRRLFSGSARLNRPTTATTPVAPVSPANPPPVSGAQPIKPKTGFAHLDTRAWTLRRLGNLKDIVANLRAVSPPPPRNAAAAPPPAASLDPVLAARTKFPSSVLNPLCMYLLIL